MRISSLTFKSGEDPSAPPLVISPGRITIFVGPNNGGKSSALREIAKFMSRGKIEQDFLLIEAIYLEGELSEFEHNVKALSVERNNRPPTELTLAWRGKESTVNGDYLRQLMAAFARGDRNTDFSFLFTNVFTRFFLNLTGASRLELSQGAATSALTQPATTTIAQLFRSPVLLKKLSDICWEAFGSHLCIDATSMQRYEYALSGEMPSVELMQSFGAAAVAFFGKAQGLSTASDGTKAFVGILAEIIAGDPELIVMDEPEAFLHPGLAYLMGREVALNVASGKQVFAATHSPHFLMGCLSAGVAVDVVRLTHRAGTASARLLPAADLRQMMNDPLLRSMGVITALFFQNVVVVEADADRAFYDEINSRLVMSGLGGIRHVTFINATGKQTVSDIVRPLRSVGIPVAAILDLDWIKEDGAVAARYMELAGVPDGLRPGLLDTRRTVRRYLENASANYKREGGIDLLRGQELETARDFFGRMDGYGLFTVRTGEIESWLPSLSISREKTRWLRSVFEALGSNPESSTYLRPGEGDVWRFLLDISQWLSDVRRT